MNPLKISYDAEVDVLTIYFSKAPIDNSDEIAPNVIADYDAQGNAVSLEILHFSRYKGIESLLPLLQLAESNKLMP